MASRSWQGRQPQRGPGRNFAERGYDAGPIGRDMKVLTSAEPALPAWEVQRLRLPGALTWRPWRSGVTVVDPSSPWLMAL